MAFVGGNSSLSGGMFAVPGSSVQKEQGIKDSPEALMADMERIGLGLGDPQHIRFVCEHAAETFEWTRSYIGVDWNPTLTGKGGHSAERCLITRQGTGQGIIVPAVKKLASLGVKPRTGCFMEKILRSPEGRVQGVEIREGYVFGKPAAGTVKRIGARRAVVLACGGFGADVKYRQKLDPKLGAQFLTLALSDSDGVAHLEKLRPGLFDQMIAEKTVVKYEDAEALAKAYKMVPEVLKKTIAQYNDDLAKQSDPKFGRRFDRSAKPIGSGPYYVSEMSPKVHHCMGGVATAVDTAVLDVMTDKPIPGLFAAGEFVGGIHGAVRIGACAVMDCLVNGREAGRMAAQSKAWF